MTLDDKEKLKATSKAEKLKGLTDDENIEYEMNEVYKSTIASAKKRMTEADKLEKNSHRRRARFAELQKQHTWLPQAMVKRVETELTKVIKDSYDLNLLIASMEYMEGMDRALVTGGKYKASIDNLRDAMGRINDGSMQDLIKVMNSAT